MSNFHQRFVLRLNETYRVNLLKLKENFENDTQTTVCIGAGEMNGSLYSISVKSGIVSLKFCGTGFNITTTLPGYAGISLIDKLTRPLE